MERLFSLCTRLHDRIVSQGRRGRLRSLQELDLNVSTEELLSAERGFTFADLYEMLESGETVAWLTPRAAVVRAGGRAINFWNELDESSCRFIFTVDGTDIIAFARSTEHLLEICDVVLRLLAVSVVHAVMITNWRYLDIFINAPTLAYLMEHCQSLKFLSLKNLEMDENHCRVLGDYSRPGLEIVLDGCNITSAGASALVEVLERNQGPTKIDQCHIDHVVLADGLRGNRRLRSLKPRFSSYLEANREVLAIAGGLRENKGLVEFDLSYSYCVIDEAWGAICDSLETHPTLEVLDLRGAFRDVVPVLAVLKCQIQSILNLMKRNLSLHTIHLPYRYTEH
jgi:hypothetical protein